MEDENIFYFKLDKTVGFEYEYIAVKTLIENEYEDKGYKEVQEAVRKTMAVFLECNPSLITAVTREECLRHGVARKYEM